VGEYIAVLILNSELDWGELSYWRSGHFNREEVVPGAHLIGG